MITTLDEVIEKIKRQPSKKIVVAYANDFHTIEAVYRGIELKIIEGILVGDQKKIEKICKEHNYNTGKFEIVHEPDVIQSAYTAVELLANDDADLITKGMLSTDKYMKAVMNREYGLVPPGSILCHVAVFDNPLYHKLIILTDSGIIPEPNLRQKIALTEHVIYVAHSLGIKKPKVAIIAATELVLPYMRSNIEASVISKMADRGQITGAIIDGPLSFDVSVDQESAKTKQIDSEVAGDADCLVFPNIETGNVFYKVNTLMTEAKFAGVVVGAKKPVVLSSRGDNTQTKLYSIALGSLLAE